ncbi:bifunctional enzyme CysN/CysC [Geobacter sp. OR-1]|uniref:adenylyl-sulfate kinase n=1 Tax=Geobacter sp. OR-1 TaxID=1266765 RepID=UPI0005432008|nr:adenylyl-sulfate kinase [Geobacter sp. OR-1]GAM08913.1 bifunctional enzyme CysN/CysC [Geobacter sp. OR-1]
MSEPDILHFLTAGSVDDGKSTLIGRLLYDADALYDDHVAALRRTAATGNAEMDFSLITDGLRAEREQGITIDVAYRYFSTSRRRFIIADAPGHEQYTRNMATAASHADLALLLIDAEQGVSTQSKRHAFICALLGIPRFVVAINKMDLVGYSEERFREIETEYRDFAVRLGLANLQFIPVCAVSGENVVRRGTNMAWYDGAPLLSFLEEVYVAGDRNLVDFRLAVQRVIHLPGTFRGFGGRVSSGVLRCGDEVMVLPSGFRSRVASIAVGMKQANTAAAGESITVSLADDIDVGRGDLLVHPGNVPRERRELEAMLVWTGDEPLVPGGIYQLKHATRWLKARCDTISYRVDPNTLSRETVTALSLNDIGRARFTLFTPVLADEYRRSRELGSFIVVSISGNDTLGAATIVDRTDYDAELKTERAVPDRSNIVWHQGQVTKTDRSAVMGHRPATLWMTGLSGAGKSTVAFALERSLIDSGHPCFVLDGDNVRHGLNRDLGFSPKDRAENIRRVAEVARLMNEAGLIVITSFISPFRDDREMARQIIGSDRFIEVYLSTRIEECERRDVKGFYKKARAGELQGFTGVSAPYEPPDSPVVLLDTELLSIEESITVLQRHLEQYYEA